MMKPNRVLEKLRSGDACYGTMLRDTRSPQVIQLLSAAGWDFVVVDTEHGPLGMQDVADLAAAARSEEIALLVRVPDAAYHLVARPLDNGADGIVCPRVEARAAAETVVSAARYAPEGKRGVSISGVATGYRSISLPEYLELANRNTLVTVQIESVQSLEKLDEILSVPGIDATLIGPADLSQSMGIPGEFRHPRMSEAFESVIAACRRHGVAPGVHLQDADSLVAWRERGMRFLTYKTDFRLLQDASREALARLRSPLPAPPGSA